MVFKKLNKQQTVQFFWFNVGGVAFFVLGYFVFAVLFGVGGWEWWQAKIAADLSGWTANYVIQRYIAFREESQHHTERKLIMRFTSISLINAPLDYLIVGVLFWLGVTPFIGLIVSSIFFTVWKYFWYKLYVFRHPAKKQSE
jgi:putative flippase GtrA